MSGSRVPEVHIQRLPHRHAVIRLRQAYGKLRQLAAAVEALPKADEEKSKQIVQEVTQ